MSERLYGRTLPVTLTPTGQEQARRVADSLSHETGLEVWSSPRGRARETAQPIADRHRTGVEIDAALDEVDFGAWSGRRFSELAQDPAWRAWNVDRVHHAPPGGESIRDVERRILARLRDLGRARAGRRLALITHAEVIRTAILSLRGWSFNRHADVALPPASVTKLAARGADLALEPPP